MDVKELYQIQRISDQVVMIFCTTYVNPISYLSVIEKDLNKMDFSGKIIFDLLLSNGYSSNRFVQADVIEGAVRRCSMKVVESSSLDKLFIERTYEFYKTHSYLVESNSILLDEEKYHLIHS
jgi:hypothetical protein